MRIVSRNVRAVKTAFNFFLAKMLEFFGVKMQEKLIIRLGIIKIKNRLNEVFKRFLLGAPSETRTLDPMIKSHLLYQLS